MAPADQDPLTASNGATHRDHRTSPDSSWSAAVHSNINNVKVVNGRLRRVQPAQATAKSSDQRLSHQGTTFKSPLPSQGTTGLEPQTSNRPTSFDEAPDSKHHDIATDRRDYPSKTTPPSFGIDKSHHTTIAARNIISSSPSQPRGSGATPRSRATPAMPSLTAAESSSGDSVVLHEGRRNERSMDWEVPQEWSQSLPVNNSWDQYPGWSHDQGFQHYTTPLDYNESYNTSPRPKRNYKGPRKSSKQRFPKPPKQAPVEDEEINDVASNVPSNIADNGAGIDLAWAAWNNVADADWETQSRAWAIPATKTVPKGEYLEDWCMNGSDFEPCTEKICEKVDPPEDKADYHDWLARNDTPDRTHDYWVDEEGRMCNTVITELAQRAWWVHEVNGVDITDWWANHVKDPDIQSDDPEPWWARYRNPFNHYLRPLHIPDDKVDPEENDMKKVNNFSSDSAPKPQRGKTKKFVSEGMQGERRKAEVLNNMGMAPPINEYSPRMNIYLRPAEKQDVPQMLGIQNHYIEKTVACPEVEPLTERGLRDRMAEVREAKLPWIVAVNRDTKSRSQYQYIGNPKNGTLPKNKKEHVVGFGYADDYNDRGGMYRYVVELEIFTDPAFLRYGVGKTLIDKLTLILDPHYIARGGYDFECGDADHNAGGTRIVGTIIVNLPYEQDDPSVLEWKQKWLDQFEFKEVGRFEDFGRKLSKVVNLAVFRRKTMSTIHPWAF